MKKKLFFNVLRILISLGLILFLLWLMRGSIDEVAATIKKANRPILFISFLFSTLVIVLLGVRLSAIMKAQHLKLTLKDAVSLTFIGQFFSNFLPTTTGGDIVKAYYASRQTGKKLHSIACIIVDRLLGTFTFVLMVLTVSLFVKTVFLNKAIKGFILIALAISFVIVIILFSRRVAKKMKFLSSISRLFKMEEIMKELYEIIYNYRRHPALLLNALFISFLLQSVSFFSVYLIIKSLGFDVPLKLVFLWMPIISTAAMAPSINGLGVRESSFVFFFGPMMGKEGAFALSLLWLGINFFISLIGGVLYMFKKQHKHEEIPKGVRA